MEQKEWLGPDLLPEDGGQAPDWGDAATGFN